MIITCPSCNLSKELGNVDVSRTGTAARCPRCHTLFNVRPDRQEHWIMRRRALLGTLIAVFAVGSLLIAHDWKLDKNYFLQPGTWQGDMTYRGKKHPFELVIEKAQDGCLEGYMDWVEYSPRYRLAIRGSYLGNHLVFKDYEFLERKGTTGLNDEQDVYIIAEEMRGTAKDGNAELTALKRTSASF